MLGRAAVDHPDHPDTPPARRDDRGRGWVPEADDCREQAWDDEDEVGDDPGEASYDDHTAGGSRGHAALRARPPGRHRAPLERPARPDRSELAARLNDRLPSTLQGARVSVPTAAALGLLVLTALAALAIGVRTTMAAPAGDLVPAREVTTVSADAGGGAGAPSTATVTTAADPVGGQTSATAVPTPVAPVELQVHVVGQVARPGVVELTAGARVADAVEAAGGLSADADTSRVNLARAVTDGEQLVVPRPGEAVPAPVAAPAPAPIAGAGTGGAAGAGSSPEAGEGAVDLNAADLAELDTLPGVGPVLAQRILDWRAENGRFSSVEELDEVSGIGDKVLAELRERVRV